MKAGNTSVSPMLAVAITLSILALSCERGEEDIVDPDPVQATVGDVLSDPDLFPTAMAELQTRALSAACLSVSCGTKPVYAYLDAEPDHKAALEDAFGADVEFLSNQELQDATRPGGTFTRGATLFDITRTHFPADDIAAVDIWVEEGFGIGKATTLLFRWSGSHWEETTPAETGVTVTTATS